MSKDARLGAIAAGACIVIAVVLTLSVDPRLDRQLEHFHVAVEVCNEVAARREDRDAAVERHAGKRGQVLSRVDR